ncbi:hypothetical protein HDU96_005961 [Phlyctochytrium bullatum]|nr:hypothetical protein HDU96_005961 [Phlyctochytrium bullatum]
MHQPATPIATAIRDENHGKVFTPKSRVTLLTLAADPRRPLADAVNKKHGTAVDQRTAENEGVTCGKRRTRGEPPISTSIEALPGSKSIVPGKKIVEPSVFKDKDSEASPPSKTSCASGPNPMMARRAVVRGVAMALQKHPTLTPFSPELPWKQFARVVNKTCGTQLTETTAKNQLDPAWDDWVRAGEGKCRFQPNYWNDMRILFERYESESAPASGRKRRRISGVNTEEGILDQTASGSDEIFSAARVLAMLQGVESPGAEEIDESVYHIEKSDLIQRTASLEAEEMNIVVDRVEQNDLPQQTVTPRVEEMTESVDRNKKNSQDLLSDDSDLDLLVPQPGYRDLIWTELMCVDLLRCYSHNVDMASSAYTEFVRRHCVTRIQVRRKLKELRTQYRATAPKKHPAVSLLVWVWMGKAFGSENTPSATPKAADGPGATTSGSSTAGGTDGPGSLAYANLHKERDALMQDLHELEQKREHILSRLEVIDSTLLSTTVQHSSLHKLGIGEQQ